ncbi:MAG: hypothetical protein BBJ57_09255 [Desulfobacterales bacterium PC51MH44]|nr:MAG: hypothetical protein BBJ57_09255 [Desulfobacterales bacterium PC51MH44]
MSLLLRESIEEKVREMRGYKIAKVNNPPVNVQGVSNFVSLGCLRLWSFQWIIYSKNPVLSAYVINW